MLSRPRKQMARRLTTHDGKQFVTMTRNFGKPASVEKSTVRDESRFNAMKIQMLPDKLHKQIFKNASSVDDQSEEIMLKKRNSCIEKLKKFDLWDKCSEILPNVEFALPPLKGKNINEHFKAISIEQCGDSVEAIFKLCSSSLPEKPKSWSRNKGWTKYTREKNGETKVESIDFPDDQVLVFDCEVLVTEGSMPVMATAVSASNWYSWCSERIFERDYYESGSASLIPMELANKKNSAASKKRIVVGHNVSYDRARIREQYYIQESNIRFVDTMSLHIAVGGFSGEQRILHKARGKNDDENSKTKLSWLDSGSMNSLSAVHKHYCGSTLEKTARNLFVDGCIDDVRAEYDNLMDYCANDVCATHDVLKKIFPIFCQRSPHPVTLAAILEMGTMYLPTNKNWLRFIKDSDNAYNDLKKELKSTLADIANNACALLHDEKYKSDSWLWDLDWSTQSYKLLKQPRKGWVAPEYKQPQSIPEPNSFNDEEKQFLDIPINPKPYKPSALMQGVLDTAASLPKVQPHLPGYPKWYTELCMKEREPDWEPGPTRLSTLTKSTPKLLRMTWKGYCLHHDRSAGWGYLVPEGIHPNLDNNSEGASNLDDEIDSDLPEYTDSSNSSQSWVDIRNLPNGYRFYKLPHRLGNDNNVGNPLSHDFMPKLDEGVLKSADVKGASRCLEINLASSYWRSNHQRVRSQIFLELPNECIPDNVKNHKDYTGDERFGAIVPMTTVFGTVSRRATESTWLTASNARTKSIGSELKAMIQAPPGYNFVGADVDSQELWIASLLGDANSAKEHGCTPLSWMTLQGTKANGTDLHSKTADAIGITRNQAKVFNYARIYGSGQRLANILIKRYNYGISAKEANEKVTNLFKMTKGERKYLLSMDGQYYARKLRAKINPSAVQGGLVTFQEVKALEQAAKTAFGSLIDVNAKDMIAGRVWDGGTESEMFNRLENIARSMNPQTPVLNARISRALEPSKVQGNFLPTRMNWIVQSSAVDYMHLMLVCMRWLIEEFSINARFSISIHDELRYLCTEEDRYRTALAMQISNILTRSMFAYRLGMNDLPLSVAFFSSVEIDKVLRKSHDDDCVTPSNPLGLQHSRGIKPGISLNIFDILSKTSGGILAESNE